MQIRKKGDENLKKSSPLKLLCQSQPNSAEMILGWFPFKIVSVSADRKSKMAATAIHRLTLDPMGKMFQNASSLKPLG